MRRFPQWRWRLDEVFVKINGKLCYLWRAVNHEGEVLETVVTAKRDKAAALKFLKRIMKKYGRPRSVVTDGLSSYPAAMSEIGNVDRQEVGRRLDNRAENSHQPFRRRERAMQRFRSAKTLQKFSSVHAQVHKHFNQERHLVTRKIYKQRRLAALGECARSSPDSRLGLGKLCHTHTTCHWSAVGLTMSPRSGADIGRRLPSARRAGFAHAGRHVEPSCSRRFRQGPARRFWGSPMIVATTENIAGHRTVQTLGQCFGVVVRSGGLGGNLVAGQGGCNSALQLDPPIGVQI